MSTITLTRYTITREVYIIPAIYLYFKKTPKKQAFGIGFIWLGFGVRLKLSFRGNVSF